MDIRVDIGSADGSRATVQVLLLSIRDCSSRRGLGPAQSKATRNACRYNRVVVENDLTVRPRDHPASFGQLYERVKTAQDGRAPVQSRWGTQVVGTAPPRGLPPDRVNHGAERRPPLPPPPCPPQCRCVGCGEWGQGGVGSAGKCMSPRCPRAAQAACPPKAGRPRPHATPTAYSCLDAVARSDIPCV